MERPEKVHTGGSVSSVEIVSRSSGPVRRRSGVPGAVRLLATAPAETGSWNLSPSAHAGGFADPDQFRQQIGRPLFSNAHNPRYVKLDPVSMRRTQNTLPSWKSRSTSPPKGECTSEYQTIWLQDSGSMGRPRSGDRTTVRVRRTWVLPLGRRDASYPCWPRRRPIRGS